MPPQPEPTKKEPKKEEKPQPTLSDNQKLVSLINEIKSRFTKFNL